MAPSTKTLREALPGLSEGDIREIRHQMRLADAVPSVQSVARALARIDAVLGTHGVERIPPGRNKRSPAIVYCNTGDTYGTTILYVNGGFRVGCWGDIVERGDYE